MACAPDRSARDPADPGSRPGGDRLRPAEQETRPRIERDREGADLSAEGPDSPGTGPSRHRHDRVPHSWRAGRQGGQPRGPRRPEQSGALADPSSRAPATSAGSPSRPFPSSTFTRSTTGAREIRASRPPGQARPDSCSRPATGRTATSITWTRSARRSIPRSLTGPRLSLPSSIRFNPFWPNPEPFLSEYHGTLRISRAGTYRFFTSSQDCSFLLIDGKVVVAAPGWHGPVHDSRIKGEVNLSAGTHDFQYLHAAAGGDACMVAAWQPPGASKPEPIPPEAFGAEAIARLSRGRGQAPARIHRGHRGRGSPGRERPAPGSRPVPLGLVACLGVPAQGCTGTSATARRAR